MSEWERRQLCADGNCVGVIGDDGVCKVCGRAAPNWGDERKRGTIDEPHDAGEDAGPIATAPAPAPAAAAAEPEPERDGEWDQRRLCADDACVGVIGDDDKCKICGKAAA